MPTKTPTFSIKCNVAGQEASTEEVLHTGLTIKEASATIRSLYSEWYTYEAAGDLMDGNLVNFIAVREQ